MMALPPLHKTDHIKVWGSPGASRSKCVISAHGEAVPRVFALRLSEMVQFYVPPGQSIDLGARNAGLFQIAAGKVAPPIPATRNNSPNYSLSKFEGYHKGYSGTLGSAYEATFLKLFSSESADWGTYEGIKDVIRHGGVADPNAVMSLLVMDIVTIRFRPHKTDPTLDLVIQELRSLGYKEFHCPFCRG
jgi:hypothetical protein